MTSYATLRAFALCVVALLTWAGEAQAGGSKADYARAAAMPQRVRGKVRNERLRETWLDDHTLVYRRESAGGTWRFMLVDAKNGDAREAFDHAKVAAGLAKVLGAKQDADRLGVRFLAREKRMLLLQAGARVVAVDPKTHAVKERPAASVPELGLAPSGATRSHGGGGDTALLFVNRSKQAVDLVWLDHGGGAKTYATLQPGKTHRQQTFPGHAWRVQAADGTVWGSYTAERSLRVVYITGKTEEPVKESGKKPSGRRPSDSPDGRYRASIREHNVVLEDRKSGKQVVLSEDGTAADTYRGRWSWSPDSRYLVAVQEEPAQSRRVHVVNSVPRDQFQPRLRSFNYLKPGDRIARPRPRVFDVKKRERVEIADDLYAKPWAIGRFVWSADGKRFLFHYNERGHQTVRFVELDPRKRKARALIEETSDTFVDYSQKTWLHAVPGSQDWLWMSERSGWNHLYRIDGKSGRATPVTQGSWLVRRVLDVDDESQELTFEAMGVVPEQDPYHVHVGRVGFDGGEVTWLTDGDGTHALEYSPDRTYYVDTWSRVDLAPVHALRRTRDGSLVRELERADWSALLEEEWQPTQRFHAKGRDGRTDIWGVIHLPSDFDPKKRYPVIESIYAGPHGHFVPKRFRAWSGAKAMAELGFVVVQIDGMGTNWRSKAFHDVCWQNLGDSGFPDRIAWMRAAAKTRPWMDLERVGIYGGSAGGQSALRALLAHGDFYDVAVADCGCHDNRMDKIWWNEAWMGWPIGPHYAEQSNITQAHRLTGKLLLIVGEVDRNVDPASTYKVVDALIRADKDFDLLVIPGQGHGAAGTPYGRRRQADFFVRHLLGVEPRH
ncbi:MAG: prolyl oligopeptidase family serine peptidase [Planctomycetota bacterium]|nr:prolyl oligopeptidase family serine peptidase [Planctomycetota bacterium]